MRVVSKDSLTVLRPLRTLFFQDARVGLANAIRFHILRQDLYMNLFEHLRPGVCLRLDNEGLHLDYWYVTQHLDKFPTRVVAIQPGLLAPVSFVHDPN